MNRLKRRELLRQLFTSLTYSKRPLRCSDELSRRNSCCAAHVGMKALMCSCRSELLNPQVVISTSQQAFKIKALRSENKRVKRSTHSFLLAVCLSAEQKFSCRPGVSCWTSEVCSDCFCENTHTDPLGPLEYLLNRVIVATDIIQLNHDKNFQIYLLTPVDVD